MGFLTGTNYETLLPAFKQACIPYVIDENCPATVDYYQHANLKWIACHEGSALGTFKNTKNNDICNVMVYKKFYKVLNDHDYGSTVGCPSCDDDTLGWVRDDNGFLTVYTNPICIETVNDETCTISIFKCDELSWDWCVRNEGAGKCTNTFLNIPKKCIAKASSICANGAENCGVIECGDDDCTASWNMPDKPQFYSSPQGCIEGINDKTCIIPHFKCEGVLWDWCVNGDGIGQCTNTFLNVVPEKCTVNSSSACTTGDKSCGVINCEDGNCIASWNMPGRPQFYDYPQGCLGSSNPFSPDNKDFMVPVSVAGGVVFIGIVTAIVTIAACFGCHRYKRQGYRHVEGSVTN